MSPAGSRVRTGAQGRPVARARVQPFQCHARPKIQGAYSERHQATSKVVPIPMPVIHSGTGS